MKHTKTLLAILLSCLLLSGCLSTAQASTPSTASTTSGAVPSNWLPSLTVESVTPTGATILFEQESEPEGYLLLCGNDYVLERKVSGVWQPLPTLQSQVFWTQAAFVVSAIPRDCIEWEWLYGSLPEGEYRIGKTITLNRNGEAVDSGLAYGAFTLGASEAAEPTPAATTPSEAPQPETAVFQPEPLYSYAALSTLPEAYSHKDAAGDHVVVLSGGSGVENREQWLSFVYRTERGEHGTVRLMDYDLSSGKQEVYDVTYDGLHYTLTWMEKGVERSIAFKHLLRMQGNLYSDPNATDRYVLTMDKDVTWEDIQWGMVSDYTEDAIPHKVVYQERSYHPSHLPVPESSRVSLSLKGKELASATGQEAEKMVALFSGAEPLSEAPQMYYKGLDLIFHGNDGSEMTLWLDFDGDHFLYDGTYYKYTTSAMLYLFGLTDWPEECVFPKH